MASGRNAVITITPQLQRGAFSPVQLQRVRWSGGSGSPSHDDQPSPERGVGSNVHEILRMQTTGTFTHEVPLIFLEQWHTLQAALRASYLRSAAETVLADTTIAFDGNANKLTTVTAGLFSGFEGLEGFPLFVKGAAEPANNSGPEKLGIIVSVTDTEIELDATLMPLTTEAAGAEVSISAGLPIKNGSRLLDELIRQYEVGLPDTVVRSVKSDAIAVDGAGNTLTGPPGTFDKFLDATTGSSFALNIYRPSSASWVNNTPIEANPATLAAVAPDGSSITVAGFDLTTEAAGVEVAVDLGGSYAQLYDMILESLQINYEGGGVVVTTASYQVDGVAFESDRSRGLSTPMSPTGDGQPIALGRMVETCHLGGVWFDGASHAKLESFQLTINTNLSFGSGLGSPGRTNPESTHISVSGSLAFEHDRRNLKDLADQQADPTHSMPAYIVVKDPVGNRMVGILPRVKLKDAFPDVSGDRVMWNTSFNAMYDSTLGATIGWVWVPAF